MNYGVHKGNWSEFLSLLANSEELPVMLMMEKGIDVNFLNSSNKYIYDLASIINTSVYDLAGLFFAHADINVKFESGYTLLMYAIQWRQRRLIRDLIRLGADVNTKDTKGWTALHTSINFPFACQQLLEAGANPNTVDDDFNRTALFEAVTQNQLETAGMLVVAKADQSIQDSCGYTPMEFATNKKNLLMCEILKGRPYWETDALSAC